jgi:cell division protein FtsQ
MPLRRIRRRPRLTKAARTAIVGLLVLALCGGGFLLLRDSSLFRVDHVRVTGATGSAAPRIAAALREAGASMTTLDVDEGALRRSVASFAQVRTIEVRTDGRNGLGVRVLQYAPVGAVSTRGRRVPVAGDGTLLRGVAAGGGLPLVPVSRGAGGPRLASPEGLRAVAVLAAAPRALRGMVERVTTGARGLGATLRQGPDVYFGGADRLAAKWAAAAGVLADEDARGAEYVDVRVPERPAAGGLADAGLSPSALDSTLASDPGTSGGQDATGSPSPDPTAAQNSVSTDPSG